MNRIFAALAILLTVLTASASSAKAFGDDKRAKIRKMADDTLKDLYKLQADSREAIRNSAGYAVFDNMGVHVLLVSTARGGGIAVDSNTGKGTFMKMISLGAGFGMGVKDYRVVFVFETEDAFTIHRLRLGRLGSS